jgi:hypothetical protein
MIGTIEREYKIHLNARSDMLLDNLLHERGFESFSQLLDAYFGRATEHAKKRRVFLSFHAEDMQQVQGFRLMGLNKSVGVDFYDKSLDEAVDSENSTYIKKVLSEKIWASQIVVCLIGNGTAWRDWVDWELRKAQEFHRGICGVRLKESRGRRPPFLDQIGAPVARWDMNEIVSAIEEAAAKRS